MRRYLGFLVFMFVCLICFSSILLAEEEMENEGQKVEYSYGEVRNATEGQITVAEYDETQDKMVEVIYIVEANTEFEDTDSLKDIAVGDNVEIEFMLKDGAKTATFISKETPAEEVILPEQLPLSPEAQPNIGMEEEQMPPEAPEEQLEENMQEKSSLNYP